MYTLRPGAVSSPRNLDAMRLEALRLTREGILAMRERRERDGIPLDEDRPWQERAGEALAAANDATGREDKDAAREALKALQAALAEPLADPGEPAASEEAASLSLRIRILSDEQHTDLVAAVDAAAEAHGFLSREHLAACDEYVAVAVHSVQGFEDDDGPIIVESKGGRMPEEELTVLRSSGWLWWMYASAARFQGLTGEEKKAFGQPAPTTRCTSGSALPALTGSGTSEAVTATPANPTTQGPSTSTAPAHAGASSSTLGSTPPTPSTSAPTGESSAPTA